jgi:hypothetical protein
MTGLFRPRGQGRRRVASPVAEPMAVLGTMDRFPAAPKETPASGKESGRASQEEAPQENNTKAFFLGSRVGANLAILSLSLKSYWRRPSTVGIEKGGDDRASRISRSQEVKI